MEDFFVCLVKVVLHDWKFIEGIKKRKYPGNSRGETYDIKIQLAQDSFLRKL